MNLLDYTIIAAVPILITVGFFSGARRAAAAFVSIYFATVVAAASYQGLSDFFQRGDRDLRVATADLLAFMLLLIVMTGVFYVVVLQSVKQVVNRRGRVSILDNIGGAALATVLGSLALVMTLSVTVVLLGVLNHSSVTGDSDSLGAVGDQIRESKLVPVVVRLQPAVTVGLRPWFPNGLPAILERPHS